MVDVIYEINNVPILSTDTPDMIANKLEEKNKNKNEI